jgi:uroporphyrinogen-III synthase
MQVLITRPRRDAQALSRELERRRHRVLLEPLLTIEPLEDVVADLAGVQAIVLTSRHAVPALAGAACVLPVYGVGAATAAAVRRAGHRDVRVGGGNAADLARLIARECQPGAGPLLHLSGSEVRPELAQGLAAAGFMLHRQEVYRAQAAERLSPPTIDALRRRSVDAVLLFSPRSALILVRLLAAHDLSESVAPARAICLSAAVADPCRQLKWQSLCVAARPEVASIVGQLEGQGG